MTVAVIGILVSACGSSTSTIHGTLTPSSGSASVFGPGMNSTTYAGRSVTSPSPGTQVTVTDPSGKVIGTGTLAPWSTHHARVSGTTVYSCAMPFTISGVPSESRYGFRISGVPGTIWETSVKHVSLQVTSSG